MFIENFQNREIHIPVNEAHKASNSHNQKSVFSHPIKVKIPEVSHSYGILQAVTEKQQITYKNKLIENMIVFSSQNLKANVPWIKVL